MRWTKLLPILNDLWEMDIHVKFGRLMLPDLWSEKDKDDDQRTSITNIIQTIQYPSNKHFSTLFP